LTLLQQLAAPVKNQTVDCIFKIKHYLDANFSRPINMEQLAESVNLNPSYMSTAFRKYVGRSPQQYLIDVRLERAAELLVNEGYAVGLAAAACGYPDVYHFSKIFRKRYGVSPTAYCKQQSPDEADEKKP
jgi:iron complex transport system substrate-binding protein